jgi:hypothetical protein
VDGVVANSMDREYICQLKEMKREENGIWAKE